MRLFVAICASEEVERHLKELQKKFSGAGDFKFVKDFHLTLKFLGDIADEKIDRLDELLLGINHGKFELVLNKVGVFPGIRNARVLWVDVNGDVKSLWQMVESTLCKEFGCDDRFKEHITLARIKDIGDKKLFEELMNKVEVQKITFNVDDFKLIKSELRRDGTVYTELKVYKLM